MFRANLERNCPEQVKWFIRVVRQTLRKTRAGRAAFRRNRTLGLNGFGRDSHQEAIVVDADSIDIYLDLADPEYFKVAKIFLKQVLQIEELGGLLFFRLTKPILDLRQPAKKGVECDFFYGRVGFPVS